MSKRAALALGLLSAMVVVVTLLVARPAGGAGRVRAEGTLNPSQVTAPPAPTTTRASTSPASTSPASTTTVAPVTTTTAPPDPVDANPVALNVPAIDLAAPIVPVGVEPGTDAVAVPPLTEVGWYEYGPQPGDAGSSVLVGHVDGNGLTGVFWELRNLNPGDTLTVHYADGSSRVFVVTGREEVPKPALPADLFSRQGPARLTLITCGGGFDYATHHYYDNVVVVATPQLA